MDYSALDDVDLIAHLSKLTHKDGNEIDLLLGELYDRFARLVYSVAYHMVNEPNSAEEITQDVFVKAYEGAASYRPELSKVSSWIITITRRRAIDEIRRRKIRFELDGIEWTEENESATLFDQLHEEDLEQEVDERLTRSEIRSAMKQLPSDQREALRLAYFGGFNQQEIADLLHEPVGTIKSRIRIAMQKMRLVLVER